MSKAKIILLIMVQLFLFVFLCHFIAEACPLCVDALKGSEIGRGFNLSILFLMLMPFALVGTIGGGLFIYVRRHSSQNNLTCTSAKSNTKGE